MLERTGAGFPAFSTLHCRDISYVAQSVPSRGVGCIKKCLRAATSKQMVIYSQAVRQLVR